MAEKPLKSDDEATVNKEVSALDIEAFTNLRLLLFLACWKVNYV